MSTTNQIVGGSFKDIESNVLSNGYLIFELYQDEVVNTTTLICSLRTIKVNLDSTGNVPASTYSLWPNDLISPANSFYLVSAYTAQGQLVWGPNPQSVLSTPSPFNLNAWVPGEI